MNDLLLHTKTYYSYTNEIIDNQYSWINKSVLYFMQICVFKCFNYQQHGIRKFLILIRLIFPYYSILKLICTYE